MASDRFAQYKVNKEPESEDKFAKYRVGSIQEPTPPKQSSPEGGLGLGFATPDALKLFNMLMGDRPPGLTGLGRAAPIAAQDVVNAAGGAYDLVANQGGDALKQVATDPMRALKNMASGGAELVEGVANLPRNAPSIAAHFGMVEPEVAETNKILPKFDFAKYFKVDGEPQPGDELLRKGVANLPFWKGPVTELARTGKNAIKGGYGKVTRAIREEDPIIAAKVDALNEQVNDTQGNLEAAKTLHAGNEEAMQASKEASEIATGKSNPSTMEFGLNKTRDAISEADQQIADVNEQLNSIKPPSPMDEQVKSAEQGLSEAQQQHETALGAEQEFNRNIEQHLNKGASHPTRIGNAINEKINQIESHFSESYKKLMDKVKESKFQMPNTSAYALDMENVLKQLRAGTDPSKVKATENPELKGLMDLAPTAADSSATEFLNKYKDFRDRRFDLSQRLKQEQSASKRQEMVDALRDSKKMEDVIKKTLDEGLGEHKAEFERVNKGYSDLIFPLRAYKVARSIKNTGKTSENAMKSFSGTSAYPRTAKAQQAIRDMVKSDPELLKNVVGQRYANKIEDLHQPNEMAQEYLDQMPELKKLVQGKETLRTDHIAKGAEKVAAAKQRHKQVSSEAKKANEKIAAADKERSALQEKINKTHEQRSALEAKIEPLEKHIADLREKASNKKVSLKNKMALEKELSGLKAQLKELKVKRDNSVGSLRIMIRAARFLAKKAALAAKANM